ncbi:MAG: 2-phosphosulfolactate phosphatase, partial [Clostridia bacterium]|nr:2-phosphosulfolactate phosphatase [Clostridia bacterium]
MTKNGAARLYAVGDKALAYEFKEKDPTCILIGEREGKKLPGFDYGNSPSDVE